jgi:hypothetical protein
MAEKNSDSGIYEVLREVGGRIGAERVGEVLSGLVDGAARTRVSLERNLENLLGYANIPSRAEYEQLVRVVEGLTASVERLGKRIDDLALRAAQSAERTPAGRRPRATAAKKAAKAGSAKKARAANTGGQTRVSKKSTRRRVSGKPAARRRGA